jgi:regulator of RNase E activity RraA
MFVLNDLPPQIDPAAIDLLAGAEPATIGHFLEYGFMDPGIRALVPGRRVAGTAVTVRVSVPDAAVVHYAIGRIRPGDVLVIDRAGDQRHAVFGGYAAFAAQAAGCRAIVADGVVTDIGELRGLSTVTTKRLFQHGEFCVPVSCGGVPVLPGDAILADDNGVLVLRPDQVAPAARRAIALQEEERRNMDLLRAGARLSELNGTDRRLAEIVAQQRRDG